MDAFVVAGELMKLIDRYIISSVIASTLLVMLILLGVESFVEFINELGDIGTGNYGILLALVYVPMTLPSELYQLFPMAGLLGSLLGLGRLASSNQLIVVRAAGVSKTQITLSVIKAALIMMVVVTFIGEAIAPRLDIAASNMKTHAMGKATGYSALQNIWFKQGADFINVGQVDSLQKVKDVTRYEFDKNKMTSMLYAKTALLQNGVWRLQHPVETQIFNRHVVSKLLKEAHLKIPLKAQLFSLNSDDPGRLSIITLWHTVHFRKAHGLLSDQSGFALWQRIVQPLTTLVMICLGIPFIFGSLRNVTMGYRMMMGILLGFGFYMLNQFFGPFSMVYQVPPWLAAIVPTLLFALAGGVMMRKTV
jgi:lipopolysaccharide export system permease protein